MLSLARCYVLNLERRPDRWAGFVARMPADWPRELPAAERVSAVDGRETTVPDGWESGPGAWGCLQSHLALWDRIFTDGQPALILEDDATFCADFACRLADFAGAVPPDWDLLYLGGQHILPPATIPGLPSTIHGHSPTVVRCQGVKKTHAYAITPAACQKLYGQIAAAPYHIDVALAMLHRGLNVYAPGQWLCGQAAGVSDVLNGDRGQPERWFDGRKAVAA